MQLPWRSVYPPVRRAAPSPWLPSATAWLLAAQVSVFVLQWAVREVLGGRDVLLEAGGVSAAGLRAGRVWEPLTALFVTGGPGAEWTLTANWLVLALVGRALETVVGRRHLTQIFFLAGGLGGLTQVAATVARHGTDLPIGEAAAANCGIFFALACVAPQSVLLPGVAAARRLKIVHGAAGAAALLTLGAATGGAAGGVQALALGGLAGGLTGCLSMRALGFGGRAQEPYPEAGPASGTAATPPSRPAVVGKVVSSRFTPRELRMTPSEFISERIDPILEKISRQGIGSLTAEERRVLDKGREKISQGS